MEGGDRILPLNFYNTLHSTWLICTQLLVNISAWMHKQTIQGTANINRWCNTLRKMSHIPSESAVRFSVSGKRAYKTTKYTGCSLYELPCHRKPVGTIPGLDLITLAIQARSQRDPEDPVFRSETKEDKMEWHASCRGEMRNIYRFWYKNPWR